MFAVTTQAPTETLRPGPQAGHRWN